jgi:heterodisulfide reductase subunit C
MYRIERSRDDNLTRIAMLEMARLCYTCGICVGDCPAARFSDDFNPRQIFLKVCLGVGEGLTGEDSPIWKCTTCYTCSERCPAGVKPLDVILALRNLSFKQGACPEGVKAVRASVLEKGVVGAVTQRITDLRKRMNLPEAGDDQGSDLEQFISEA